MLSWFVRYFRNRYQEWLRKRIPSSREFTLTNRRIFIFLSRAGQAFCGFLFLLLVIAVNYQNNMVFALLFLLCSVFIVCLFHSYKNLSGLTIELFSSGNAFAGDNVQTSLRFSASNHTSHQAVIARWSQYSEGVINLGDDDEIVIDFHLPALHRGRFIPPRLLVESSYPLGLYRAWTWLSFNVDSLVYPAPLKCDFPKLQLVDADDEGEITTTVGNDDFYGFKQYQPGDSLKRVYWPAYAKGQPLISKEFVELSSNALSVDFNSFNGPLEQRLSNLCYWILQFNKLQQNYTVSLDGVVYGPDKGEAFTYHLLSLLANYQQHGASDAD